MKVGLVIHHVMDHYVAYYNGEFICSGDDKKKWNTMLMNT